MWSMTNQPGWESYPVIKGLPMRLSNDEPGGLSRRQFLRRSMAVGVTASTASLWWKVLESSAQSEGAAAATLPQISDFLAEDQIAELIKLGLSRGAEFAEVYGEYTVNTSFVVDEQKLKTAQYGVLSGVGIRVIKGDQTGYAYADEYGMEALREAAEVAATIASGSGGNAPSAFRVSEAKPPFVLEHPAPTSASEVQKVQLAKRVDEAARAYDPRIAQVTAIMADSARSLLIANSNGLWVTDRQYVSRLGCYPTAIEGDNRQSGFGTAGGQVNADYFDTVRTPENTAKDAAAMAIALLSAEDPKAGTYPVVIAPGWGGVLVHECFGHSLEGDSIRKKSSLRAFQLGEPVCSEIVNIYDDGTVPFSRGSFKVDDEGTPSRKNHVVEDGILKGYLWDYLNANLTGHQPTGNGRRNSYRDYPIPRMTNTYIGAGNDEPESLIASVKDGLYCKTIGGGSVNPADGNFSFVVNEGYRIENGKIGPCVKGATLTGNAAEAMLRVSGLGNDLGIDGKTGNCGKDGQWKPVGVGQPTVLFSELTVGGTQA
jgi:TldD protein